MAGVSRRSRPLLAGLSGDPAGLRWDGSCRTALRGRQPRHRALNRECDREHNFPFRGLHTLFKQAHTKGSNVKGGQQIRAKTSKGSHESRTERLRIRHRRSWEPGQSAWCSIRVPRPAGRARASRWACSRTIGSSVVQMSGLCQSDPRSHMARTQAHPTRPDVNSAIDRKGQE